MLQGVMEKVSRVLNERAQEGESLDFDLDDPDLLLRPDDDILTRRDSRP